jgi:23S rRNA (uracil1939-C5)-methyltransferase
VAVETSEASVIRAEKRIGREHRKNLQFVQSTAYRFLESMGSSQNPPFEKGGRGGFDRILLDPPRKGASECLEGIAKLKAPVLVYVSCDPSTLARDIKILSDLGYRHEFSQAIDMFPQTYHIESVTRMRR